jgi:hypothetical protein
MALKFFVQASVQASVQVCLAYNYNLHYDCDFSSEALVCNVRDCDDAVCDNNGDDVLVGYKRDIYIQDKGHIQFAYKYFHLQ